MDPLYLARLQKYKLNLIVWLYDDVLRSPQLKLHQTHIVGLKQRLTFILVAHQTTHMNCRVVVEAAVPVYDVETPDEAVRIAISKTGEMLNPDLNYVEIDMGDRSCPHCGDELEPAFIAADESLVALELEMTVFNVEREEHASRIARKEIGQRLSNIPLDVVEIEVIEEDDEEEDDEDESTADDEEEVSETSDEVDTTSETDGGSQDDEVLPEFEELIDE
jgi:uncharacterized protein (UPF0212 family)